MALSPPSSAGLNGVLIADTPAVGEALVATGTAAAAWSVPVGTVLDYAQKTSDTTISNSVQASADTIATGAAVTYDGTTVVLIEVVASAVQTGSTSGDRVTLSIFEDGSVLADVMLLQANSVPVIATGYGAFRKTPSAGSHTYSFRAYRTGTGNGTVFASTGAAGARVPAYIQITKVS